MVVLSLLLTFFVLLRDPFSQTVLARMFTTRLSSGLNTKIKINEITITPSLNILIKDVEVNDLRLNNIFSAKRIEVDVEKFNARTNLLKIRGVLLEDADIALKVYRGDSLSNFQFLIDHFVPTSIEDTLASQPIQKTEWDITCDAIKLKSTNFSIINENKAIVKEGMDYNRIVVNDIDLDLSQLVFSHDTVGFHVHQLNATEKSGFIIKQFSGIFELSETYLDAKNFMFETNQSNLNLDFRFSYQDFNAYNSFIQDVFIDANIRNSSLNLADIGYFAPEMFLMKNEIFLNTKVKGTVEDLNSESMYFEFGNSTRFNGTIAMKGLPYIENTFFELNIKDFYTSASDIANFALPIDSIFLAIPKEFYALGECSMIGHMKGVYRDFNSNFVLKSEIGNLLAELTMNTSDTTDLSYYKGRIQSLKFDLGKMLNAPELIGSMNLNLGFDGSGLSMDNAVMQLDGVISSLELKQNNYNQVKVNAVLADNKFDGHLEVADENIDFQFDGSVDFNKEIPEFNFHSKIKDAHLYNINVLKHDSTAVLSTQLNINYAGIKLDDMQGIIQIDSTVYQQNGRFYALDRLQIDAYYDSLNNKVIELESDFIDGNIRGEFLFKELYTSVTNLVGQYAPHLFYDSILNNQPSSVQKLNFNINLKNTDELTALLYPALKVAPNSKVEGYYYTDQESVYVQANSSEVEFNGIKLYDWYLKTDNNEDAFLIHTGSKDLTFNNVTEQDSTAIGLENFNILTSIQNDSIDFRLAWDDYETNDDNKGYLSGYLKYESKTKSEIRIKHADFTINKKKWSIDLNTLLKLDDQFISVEGLGISSEDQRFSISGIVSKHPNDMLAMSFENWNLSNFDLIINNPNLDIDGVLNGNVKFIDMYRSPKLSAQLEFDQLALNKQDLGRGELRSFWNNSGNYLDASFDIINIGNAGESRVFGITGTYFPNAIDQNLNFDINVRNFNLLAFSPFVSDFMSELEGFASGKLKLDGPLNKPRIIGNLNLMRTSVKVDYTNVKYSLANEVKFNENEIAFDEIVLYDTLGNQALCEGKIQHDYFNNFRFDINIKPENILGINTNKYQNSLFYGTAMASGDVRIHGPVDELAIDITAKSEKGTQINIPISYDSEIADTDYIIFVNSSDTVRNEIDYKVDLTGVNLNLNLSVTPDADIELFLPYKMGNIKADGSGDINIAVNSRGDFEILGDYFINEGTFLFTLQNLVNRRFSILEGGKISWTGSPYDAQIDIKTLYKTKASLAGFGISSDRRYNIDCFLDLDQELFDPAIHFNIGIPNIDKDDEQLVFAQLDVNNEAQMNQQMISLLVLGSFSSTSSTTPTAGAIGASSINVISNQLSNWLSQISKDFDVGINYRPSGQYTQEELEVALSTQLFNNRVLIDGNLGVLGSQQSSNTTNIVGDVNVEVKLTDDGRFRIKAFNRSNVNSIESNVYDDRSPNTQGVGIFYRKEFDNFGDLFKNKKQIKKKNSESGEEKI